MLQRRARLYFQHQAVKIAGIYALFAAAWIFFSDRILAALAVDLETLTLLQTFKGWLFVAVTTVLVYSLVHRHVARLLRAERELRDHLRMKSQFVSTAAHELRTPLATIMGYSELLLDDIVGASTSPQEQREFIATILDRTEVLTRIVDELLDLSRIEAGHKIPLKIESCNLDSIVAEALADFSTRFPSRIFEQLPATGDACTCQVDPVRIRQVIDNLMDNAVKYSSSTGVIRLGCGISDEHCRLLVSDNGIGLTPEQQARIFDEFYRVDASNTTVGGLGLGLSIVREIVAGHGGQVQVESEVGKGTILTIILPRRLPIVD